MTVKGGTAQACAACKYQRRKCTSECLLAPYFPADQPKVFQNVHKLFGVSNIKKTLKKLDPAQKKVAMDSIICQANIRDKYPVHGCWEEICRLRYQIWQMEEELHVVHQQLEICRQHFQNHLDHLPEDHVASHSQLELGMAPCSNRLQLFDQIPHPQDYSNIVAASLPTSQQLQHSFSHSNNEAYNNSLYIDTKGSVPNHLWAEHPYEDNNSSSMAIQQQSQLDASQQPLVIQQGEVAEDYDEMHPFFDTIDDRQSYVYSKEAYESSSEESLKDTPKCAEHVAENELKNAAACFSLTSVN
ncbi:LOB domain-containing protein 27-like [Prosopis cineraria]|uniref:LOB domain-containing protein 27-like n=1 Tax=Prosopis cineraria TaxID=364024 RepID=UPI00240EA906|nr:LOB domain-containing protein 27-like [Prosopis cineraria]